MVQKICPDCNGVFEYFPNPNYPDKRKYCDSCGEKRKAAYEAKQQSSVSPQPKPVQTQAGVQIDGHVSTQIQIVRNERPNSYEVGKAGNRFKFYFSDLTDLQDQLDSFVSLRVPPELMIE